MVPTLTLLLSVMTGPGTAATEPAPAGGAAELQVAEAPYATLREARDAVRAALRDSNRASGRDALESTPAVLTTFRRLDLSEQLPPGERRRLQAQLRMRLADLQSLLRRREQRAAGSHAGGVVANAQDLIDLIQTTIAPDTWAINGGKGTIFYYPLR
jgi:hypothetical protein